MPDHLLVCHGIIDVSAIDARVTVTARG